MNGPGCGNCFSHAPVGRGQNCRFQEPGFILDGEKLHRTLPGRHPAHGGNGDSEARDRSRRLGGSFAGRQAAVAVGLGAQERHRVSQKVHFQVDELIPYPHQRLVQLHPSYRSNRSGTRKLQEVQPRKVPAFT